MPLSFFICGTHYIGGPMAHIRPRLEVMHNRERLLELTCVTSNQNIIERKKEWTDHVAQEETIRKKNYIFQIV